MLVQEHHEVDASVLSLEDEAEEIRLSHLARLLALEASRLVAARSRRDVLELAARLLQDAGDRLCVRRVALAEVQNVADPLTGPVGVRLLLSSEDVPQGCPMKSVVGDDLLQVAVLVLDLSEAASIRGLQAALLLLPVVGRFLADPMTPGQGGSGCPCVELLEDRDDLLLRESTLAHLSSCALDCPQVDHSATHQNSGVRSSRDHLLSRAFERAKGEGDRRCEALGGQRPAFRVEGRGE